MKFRGRITDVNCIKQFTQIIGLISRLTKQCVMRISPCKIFFVAIDRSGTNSGLWADLEKGHFFNEYDMEGANLDNNEICLEFMPEQIAKSLSQLRNSHSTKSLKIKLTKKHSPCLSFEVELPSLTARCRLVVHDIPVTLISRRMWHLYQEPQMPQIQVSLYLPPLRQLQNIVTRMKNLSPHVTLSANREGTFTIAISTVTVDVCTHFKNLSMPPWDGANSSQNGNQMFSVKVDVKKLASFLQGDTVAPSGVICNISDTKMLHLFLLHDDFTLQYFLPSFSEDV